MRSAISYIRFSTPEQCEGDSLRRQLAETEAFCKRHNLHLDRTMRDMGLSAYKNEHTATGELGRFLLCIEAKQVAKGTVLVIEKLDRLSRDDVLPALNLMQKIIKAGIEIGVVANDKIYGQAELKDSMHIMMLVMQFATANEESKKKEQRLGAVWQQKRTIASNAPMTSVCPKWLKLVEGKWVILKDRAAIVKRVYALAIEGYGVQRIIQIMLKETGERLAKTTISRMLTSKVVIGEFQPYSRKHDENRKRKPIGEPIPNYYPAVISEATYYKCQKVRRAGYACKGRCGKDVPNLFTGLLYHGEDQTPFSMTTKGDKKCLLTTSMRDGLRPMATINYDRFERGFLGALTELTINDLMPPLKTTDSDENISRLNRQLAKIEHKMQEINKRILADDDFTAGLDLLQKLNGQRKAITIELEQSKARATTTESRTLQEATDTITLLREGKGDDTLRTKAKSLIRQLIKRVDIDVNDTPYNHNRQIDCMVTLSTGMVAWFGIWGGTAEYARVDADGKVITVTTPSGVVTKKVGTKKTA